MLFKVLSGPYLNHLTRMANPATANPVMLTLFPASNAYDDRSSKPAIFSVAQNDSTLTFDLNMVRGSEFESAGEAAEWTMLGVGTTSSRIACSGGP